MKKVCHITSVHPRYDIRIYHKECKSLSKLYNVSLIVADDKGDEIKDNIHIYDVGKHTGGRIKRITDTPKKILKKALELNSDIYHFHDPELITTGIKLRKKGKTVIYDAHEDTPKQTLSKEYIPKYLRYLISKIILFYENYAVKRFNHIITATPAIKERFLKQTTKTTDINNFPLTEEYFINSCWKEKENAAVYIGQISEPRGIYPLIESFNKTIGKLNLAGEFESEKIENKVKKINGWNNVVYYGLVRREKVAEILSKSKMGIITFLPIPNHIEAQPNKIFEYMSAGIPVIASYFPLWKEIIEKNNCGICVDPINPKEITDAVNYLLSNDNIAEEMGKNGRNAVKTRYNWNIEEKRLLEIYKTL